MIEDLLNYLETTSLEPHDDYKSEFTYKEQKELYKYIKNLQKENEMLHHYKTLYRSLKRQKEEFRNWLKENRDECLTFYERTPYAYAYNVFKNILSKLEKMESNEK